MVSDVVPCLSHHERSQQSHLVWTLCQWSKVKHMLMFPYLFCSHQWLLILKHCKVQVRFEKQTWPIFFHLLLRTSVIYIIYRYYTKRCPRWYVKTIWKQSNKSVFLQHLSSVGRSKLQILAYKGSISSLVELKLNGTLKTLNWKTTQQATSVFKLKRHKLNPTSTIRFRWETHKNFCQKISW